MCSYTTCWCPSITEKQYDIIVDVIGIQPELAIDLSRAKAAKIIKLYLDDKKKVKNRIIQIVPESLK